MTRIAFWLPSACGIAPTPMKAPGFTSASVARTTPYTAALSAKVTRCSSPLPCGLTTMVGPSTPTMVPTTRTVFCCASADVTTSVAAMAAPANVLLMCVLIMVVSSHRGYEAVAAVAHGRRFDGAVWHRLGVVEHDAHARLKLVAIARNVTNDDGLWRHDHLLLAHSAAGLLLVADGDHLAVG